MWNKKGNELIVAPIFYMNTTNVNFPAGHDWFNLITGKLVIDKF